MKMSLTTLFVNRISMQRVIANRKWGSRIINVTCCFPQSYSTFEKPKYNPYIAPKEKTSPTTKLMQYLGLRRPREYDYNENDKVSKDFTIVYNCTLYGYISSIQYMIFFGTILVIVVLLTFRYLTEEKEWFLVRDDMKEGFTFPFMVLCLFGCVQALGMTVLKLPMRIYKNRVDDRFIVVFPKLLPMMQKKVEFKAGDMRKPVSDDASWLFRFLGQYRLYRRKVIMDTDNFRLPDDYNQMMGYVKNRQKDVKINK